MYKIRFDVEYGFKTDKTQEEAVNMICEQLNIEPYQIKNMQFYNMDRWETELEQIYDMDGCETELKQIHSSYLSKK